jgi:hypothetical protein
MADLILIITVVIKTIVRIVEVPKVLRRDSGNPVEDSTIGCHRYHSRDRF